MTWTTYTNPFTLNVGNYTILYRATDASKNVSKAQTINANVVKSCDTTGPVVD